MGLFDGLVGQVFGSLSEGDNAQQGGALGAIMNLIAQHPGGLSGLIRAFEANGMGGAAASWVGTGSNLPISAEQVQSVLGGDELASVAAALGFSQQQASAQLADALPQVVDKLTPTGAVPDDESFGTLLASWGKR